MEELLYLPPRAQAPAIDYGIAIGIPPRVSGRGIHCPKLSGRLNFRCSSWSCHFVFLHLIDNPMRVAGSTRTGPARSAMMAARSGVGALLNQRVKRQPLFAPAADSPSNFVTTLARGSALIETSSASSNAPNPTGIRALLPTLTT